MKEPWVPWYVYPSKVGGFEKSGDSTSLSSPSAHGIRNWTNRHQKWRAFNCMDLPSKSGVIFWVSSFIIFYRGVYIKAWENENHHQGRRLAIQMALTNPTRNTTTHEPASVPPKSPPWNATSRSWGLFFLGWSAQLGQSFFAGGVVFFVGVLGFIKTVKW